MFSPYKKTLTGLPVRNIDYGTLYAKDPTRDVKRSLEPEFLATLDSMCNSGTMQTTSTPNKSTSQNVSNPSNNLSGISNHGNNDSRTLGNHGNNGSRREGSPLHGMIRDVHCCVKCGVSPCCCKLFCGVCRYVWKFVFKSLILNCHDYVESCIDCTNAQGICGYLTLQNYINCTKLYQDKFSNYLLILADFWFVAGQIIL